MLDTDSKLGDPRYSGAIIPRAEAALIDAGLRTYLLRIYNYMMLGLGVTGLAALCVSSVAVTDAPANAAYVIRGARVFAANAGMELQGREMFLTNAGYTLLVGPLKWAIIFAPVAIVLALNWGSVRVRPGAAQWVFWIYSILIGLSLGSIFLIFTHTSLVRVFFVTAAAFGALSLVAYATQRELTGRATPLVMGSVGAVIAGAVDIYLQSSVLQWLVSVIGVFLLAGFSAWSIQRLKNEYLYGAVEGEGAERSAIVDALSLYLNFLNVILYPLQRIGQRNQ
jgi:uncharacterized protein